MGVRVRRRSMGLLLASSSIAALVIGGGAPRALAACSTSFTNTTSPGCTNTAAITGIAINNSTITSSISNTGTISNNGIALTNASTITGAIGSDGTINGGIAIDNTSRIAGATDGINIRRGSFAGGISNGGTISGGESILIGADRATSGAFLTFTITTFAGGIKNSGTLAGGDAGVLVGGNLSAGNTAGLTITISNFSGGITNSGKISSSVYGIALGGTLDSNAKTSFAMLVVSSFSGTISNSGTISAGADGIAIGGHPLHQGGEVTVSLFANGIANSGMISAGGYGIAVGGSASVAGVVAISTFAGGITNSGTITSGIAGIDVGGKPNRGGAFNLATFLDGVTNAGTISGAALGIAVGDTPGSPILLGGRVTIGSFAGGIVNQANGAISAVDTGIMVGGEPFRAGTVTISLFSGGVTNAGTVSAANGIVVGGINSGGSNATTTVAISTFAGGVTNLGTISASADGIVVGGPAQGKNALNEIGVFSQGISNGGTITAGAVGILLGGQVQPSATGVTISTFAGGITNSGNIRATTGILVDGAVLTFIGAIANSGTISGAGGTAIDVSLARNAMTINQTAGLISGDIKLSAHADVLNITGGTVSGNIIGAGTSDTVNFAPGSGNTFIYGPGFGFSGVNQVNINSGTVILNGANSATNVDVVGGTLAGTGTLGTLAVTVHSGATFAPGDGTPGTSMTITGNLAFQAGASYQVQLNPSTASFANVSGTATLAGNVLASFAPGSYLTKQYTILQSGGLSGTFAGLTTLNAPAGFAASLSYNADDVFLNLSLPVAAPGNSFTVNQANVANAIAGFFNGGGALPPGFVDIVGLTGSGLGNALTKLDGEAATDAQKGAFDLMSGFLNLMLDPFAGGRNSLAGGGASGFAAEQPATFPPDVALAYASVLKASPRPATFDQRWSMWGAAFGGYNTTKGDAAIGSNDVTASDFGFAAGADYRVAPDTILGFALAGGGTGWNLAQGLGGGRSDAFEAGVYGTTHHGPAYLAGALAFANHWLTTDRFAPADHLQASFNGQSFGARLEGGYRLAVPVGGAAIGVTPYVAAQTQLFRTPAYSEQDLTGTGFGLSYAAMSASDTRGELGARFDALEVIAHMPMILHARAAWAHDWVSNPALGALFQALPGASFTVNGAAAPRNSALASAGAELAIARGWWLDARFDGEFASGAQTYTGTGTLRYAW